MHVASVPACPCRPALGCSPPTPSPLPPPAATHHARAQLTQGTWRSGWCAFGLVSATALGDRAPTPHCTQRRAARPLIPLARAHATPGAPPDPRALGAPAGELRGGTPKRSRRPTSSGQVSASSASCGCGPCASGLPTARRCLRVGTPPCVWMLDGMQVGGRGGRAAGCLHVVGGWVGAGVGGWRGVWQAGCVGGWSPAHPARTPTHAHAPANPPGPLPPLPPSPRAPRRSGTVCGVHMGPRPARRRRGGPHSDTQARANLGLHTPPPGPLQPAAAPRGAPSWGVIWHAPPAARAPPRAAAACAHGQARTSTPPPPATLWAPAPTLAPPLPRQVGRLAADGRAL